MGKRDGLSLAERMAALPAEKRRVLLDGFTDVELAELYHDWGFWARPKQLPPEGDWLTWAVIAGRGFGKTRLGAEWVRTLTRHKDMRLALVGETLADARNVMVEGESGLLAVSPAHERPLFEPSKQRLTWPSGAMATLYSAEDPEQLRGPQHHAAWCDELAKYRQAEALWANLMMGLRLGRQPRILVTTTPRPMTLLKEIMTAPGTVVTRGSTFENAHFLAAGFLAEVKRRYEGTRLGRQELEAEILEDWPGALWSRGLIEVCRVAHVPALRRVVVAVDPPASRAGTCGIVAAGLGEDELGYVLEDCSLSAGSPLDWARAAVAAYHRHGADRLVAEINQGGDMVATVIAQVDGQVAFQAVRATRGKGTRAEPVAALYEQGRVKHRGAFPELEDQLCALGVDFEAGRDGASPDRADALVWAMTNLMLGPRAEPGIRRLR